MTNDAHSADSPSLLTRLMPKTGHGWMMAACCTLMLAYAGSIFMETTKDGTTGSGLLALLPIVGCLVMHLFMHRMMGNQCDHSKSEPNAGDSPRAGSSKQPLRKETA